MNPGTGPLVLDHNLDPGAFMWLWAKYITAPNLEKHCTASLRSLSVATSTGRRSPYSQRFSKASNPMMRDDRRLILDEDEGRPFAAMYFCGVSSAGYSAQRNYPHNVHAAVIPVPGANDAFEFEDWRLSVSNGLFTRIPSIEELPATMRRRPPEFTTCRIFRWAACILPELAGCGRSPSPALLLNPRRLPGQT